MSQNHVIRVQDKSSVYTFWTKIHIPLHLCSVQIRVSFTVFFTKDQMTFCFVFVFNVYQLLKCLLWKWINCSCCLFAQHHSYSCQYWSCRHSSSRTGHHGHCAYISRFAYGWYHSYHCSGLVLVSISMAELRT